MADPNRQGIDVDYPISKGTMGYFQQTFDTFDSERNKLINLISTLEGERVMQPRFGLGIEKYLFEQITSDLSAKLQSEINSKIAFWLPNILVNNLSIDISSGADRNTVTIEVNFSLKANPTNFDVVTFVF
jgi:uncharacterized protein